MLLQSSSTRVFSIVFGKHSRPFQPPPLPPLIFLKHQIKTVIHGKWIVDKMEFEDVDELVIAQGNNLQERKRLLWETCDCVVVLPGGTGTWDELMEVRTNEIRI